MKSELPFNNIKFLNKLHPTRVILLSFFVWAILFFTSPLVVNISLDEDAYIFLTLCVLSFIIGVSMHHEKTTLSKVPISPDHLTKLFYLIFYLALLGLGLKLIDRFVIRGISIGSDYFQNREIMETGGGNPVAILNAFFTPFGMIPLFLMWKYKLKFSRLFQVIIFILFFAQIFDALLLGSRSIIFIVFIMIGLYLFYFRKIKMTFLKAIFIAGIMVGFMLLMNYIFLERTKIFAGDNAYEIVLNQSNINFTLTASSEFKSKFEQMSPFSQTLNFTYITTVQYFTHGMIEFSYLFQHFEEEHMFGSYTFSIYSRFLHILVGEKMDILKISGLAPRQGIFTSFFGPIYIDFGWLTLLFMFFFGKVAKSMFEKAKKGYDWAIFLYFYIFIVIMFSPVFNFINGAGGIFILTSFILFYFISNRFYRYEKIH